jgi:hypothetical protein
MCDTILPYEVTVPVYPIGGWREAANGDREARGWVARVLDDVKIRNARWMGAHQ